MNEARIARMLALAKDHGLDALALIPGPNLFYVSGHAFMLTERPIVGLFPVDAPPAMILPALEAEKARADGIAAYPYSDEEGPGGAFQQACAERHLSGAALGVESWRIRLAEARLLERYAPGVTLLPADGIFAELRRVKSPPELDAMRRAVQIAEQSFLDWLPHLHAGMTEREAAARLIAEMLSHGAEGLSFDPIVCGGPNGALPHAVPGERALRRGDWVVVDWGVFSGGYASDITRMVVFGEPEGPLREIHALVLRANESGRAAVRPGVTAQEVDAAARQVIAEAGYGPQFMHRTGHGLGLECHEPPSIMAGEQTTLIPGMTFTVEPGIYLTGLGGVRIEDDVLVTEEGRETLTTLPRAPFVIPV